MQTFASPSEVASLYATLKKRGLSNLANTATARLPFETFIYTEPECVVIPNGSIQLRAHFQIKVEKSTKLLPWNSVNTTVGGDLPLVLAANPKRYLRMLGMNDVEGSVPYIKVHIERAITSDGDFIVVFTLADIEALEGFVRIAQSRRFYFEGELNRNGVTLKALIACRASRITLCNKCCWRDRDSDGNCDVHREQTLKPAYGTHLKTVA